MTVSEPNKDAQIASFSKVVDVRNVEVTVHWTRYNIQIVLNSTILFGFLATLRDLSVSHESYVVSAVITLGSIFSAIWAVFNWSGNWWVRHWNKRVATIERNGFPNVFQSTVAGSLERGARWKGVAFWSGLVPLVFSIVWFALALLTASTMPTLPSIISLVGLGLTIGATGALLNNEPVTDP